MSMCVQNIQNPKACSVCHEARKRLLVLSNSVCLPFGVCQDNYTPRGNTDSEDHLRDGSRTRGVSQLHGPSRYQVDVSAGREECRAREHATAPAVLKYPVLRGGGRRRCGRGGLGGRKCCGRGGLGGRRPGHRCRRGGQRRRGGQGCSGGRGGRGGWGGRRPGRRGRRGG